MGMFSWLTCKNFCSKSSQALDGDLKWYQYPQYALHYCICLSCRRYRSQVHTMDEVISGSGDTLYDEDDNPEHSLTEEESLRIKAALQEQAGGQ